MARLDYIIGIVGVLSSVAAAGLWLYASRMRVMLSTDSIENDLREMSRWNAYAAMAAFVAALCAAYAFARQIHWL
jgi:hypothetical protein